MQYPPPQPTNQPYYPPSEVVYLYEQSQTYLPAQEIAIYPNRKQAIWRTAICAASLILALLVLIFFSFLFHFLAGSSPTGSDFGSASLIIFACFLILILAEIAFAGWATWRMASTLLFSHKPLLLINREGITVGRMPSLSGFSIPWAEVESLHTRTFMYKYLCIRPKNQKQFLARFPLLERFIRLSNAIIGVPPLVVPQVFLERPVEEILRTLYYSYASELSYYRVQLRP